MSVMRRSREKLNNWMEARLKRVLQMSGRHDSAPDDPFLKLQWMIKHESGVIQDLLLRSNAELDEWDSAGYSVYSQFDEDGLIQHLLRKVKVDRDHFVEIGVEDYRQSNTRYLLEHSNWSGTIYDCVPAANALLDTLDLRTNYTLDFKETFVTQENINDLMKDQGQIGLFSLDIDSLDYYVFEKLEARPTILILEFCAAFGFEADISVPNNPKFNRYEHHYSGLCFGASLASLTRLAREKGYALIGCSRGPNAFYVRRDRLVGLQERTPAECYKESRYRDSRGRDGSFSYASTIEKRREIMGDAQVMDFKEGRLRTVAEVFADL